MNPVNSRVREPSHCAEPTSLVPRRAEEEVRVVTGGRRRSRHPAFRNCELIHPEDRSCGFSGHRESGGYLKKQLRTFQDLLASPDAAKAHVDEHKIRADQPGAAAPYLLPLMPTGPEAVISDYMFGEHRFTAR
jgi:hypothetical protein